jgi:hypothetical protein
MLWQPFSPPYRCLAIRAHRPPLPHRRNPRRPTDPHRRRPTTTNRLTPSRAAVNIAEVAHRRRAAQRWPVLPAPPRRMPTRPNPPLALRQIAEHRSVDPDRVSTVGYSAIISSRGVLDFLLGSPCAMNPPRRGRAEARHGPGGIDGCFSIRWLLHAPCMVGSTPRRANHVAIGPVGGKTSF